MSKLFKYYYDFMSPPSRALWIALKLGKTNFEDCPVALRKREQLTEAYKKINRFQKVPCIVDGDFHLAESVAIVRYLSDKGLFSESLYSKDLKKRARIDEFLEWQHLTLRLGCSMYFMHVWLLPVNGLAPPPSAEKVERLRTQMETNLDLFENIWFKDSNKYLVDNHLTIADLLGACEIEQTKLPKYEISRKKYPKITEWLKNVREDTNPFYDQAHTFLYKKSGIDMSKL